MAATHFRQLQPDDRFIIAVEMENDQTPVYTKVDDKTCSYHEKPSSIKPGEKVIKVTL